MQRYAAVWSEQSAGIALPMAAMTVGRGRGKGRHRESAEVRGRTRSLQRERGPGQRVDLQGEWGRTTSRSSCRSASRRSARAPGDCYAWRPRCTPRRAAARGYGSRQRNPSVPFNPEGEVRMPTLQYLITNAQLLALEQRRVGDLRLELQVRGFLPQAATGFPGAPEVTEYISIAESRWRQQLAGLGSTLGAEMLIAFPDDDEPRRRVADFLREAQRLLGGSEIDSAMLQVRKALETIKNTSGWNWPGKKRQARPHCGRAVGADPGRHGGPGQRCHARRPRHQGLCLHPGRGRDADRQDRCPAVRYALTHGCYRPRYLNIQRLNYLWTIRHSSARMAGNLIT